MNNSKKSKRTVRQNEKFLPKTQKHDVNLQKNSTLYFQIGLIVCLLVSYTALETTFDKAYYGYVSPSAVDDTIYVSDAKIYKAEEKIVEKLAVSKRAAPKNPDYKAVDNDTEAEKFIEKIIEPVTNQNKSKEPFDESSLVVIAPETPVNILAVQKVPVYPGCEKAISNEARRKCMSEKLSKHIQKIFDSGLGAQLGLEGRQKILVKFKITKEGQVEILNTRSPHEKLDKEAIRVVEKVPTMIPGMNDDKPVEVSYMLPINLNIQN